MDAYGNPLMLNGCLDPNAYALNQMAGCYPAYNYPTIQQEQPVIASTDYLNFTSNQTDNTMDPCYNISSYGAPIKLQPNYYSAYPGYQQQQQQQQFQQAAMQQFQAGCQQFQQQTQLPPITPQIYSQWSQPPIVNNQQQQQQCPQSQPQHQPQHQPHPQPQTNHQYNQNKPLDPSPVKYESSNLPYCSENVPYCPENVNYCPESNKPYKCKQPGVKAVRLPTIYKNLFDNSMRQGDELIAEYEEVLCPPERRQPRCYSRHRCHSKHNNRGHEVLAEYTEVLNYRPRHYSRERRSNDEYSDYDEYDSHYDQRSCDQYYDRSFDYSYDHSHSYDHCYDAHAENKRNIRRTRSPGPRMQYHSSKAYPNDRKPTVNIDPKITRQAYNGTPVPPPPPPQQQHYQQQQQQPQQYQKQNIDGKQIFNENYRNSRATPVSNQRNLKTPTKPQNYRL